MRRVDAEYWKILDFKLLAGRLPDGDDDSAGRMVAVVNATTARKLFGDAPAPGQRISVGGQSFEVIGVVADVLHVNAYADIWAPISHLPVERLPQQATGQLRRPAAGARWRRPAAHPAPRSRASPRLT
jgi:putative ABC transport system permease protein